MSEEHFCRLFKRTVGKTVTGFLMEYRIEKASVLLKKTEESITAVADSVGFDDVNYFSRSFKRIKGVTPSTYRRIKKGN
jgi:AraC-like DNA-binding protein